MENNPSCLKCNESEVNARLCGLHHGLTPELVNKLSTQEICRLTKIMDSKRPESNAPSRGFFESLGARTDQTMDATRQCVGDQCQRVAVASDQFVPSLAEESVKKNFTMFAGSAYFLIIVILIMTMLFAFAAVARLRCCTDPDARDESRKILITVWSLCLAALWFLFVLVIYFRKAGFSRMLPIIIGMIAMAASCGLGIWGWLSIINVSEDEPCLPGSNPYQQARIISICIGMLVILTMLVLVFTLTRLGCTVEGWKSQAVLDNAVLGSW